MLVGLDFDNTLIDYDTLFHRVAREWGLIPDELPARKNRVRDYLRAHHQEEVWTRMQGEVYGRRILEASPCEGMMPTLQALTRAGIPMCIVSHKTLVPYRGPAYDLHQAARDWLARQGFFSPDGLNWGPEHVCFELTQAAKVAQIVASGCTHYVDDLPEILELLPDSMHKILFTPSPLAGEGWGGGAEPARWTILRAWADLPGLLNPLSR